MFTCVISQIGSLFYVWFTYTLSSRRENCVVEACRGVGKFFAEKLVRPPNLTFPLLSRLKFKKYIDYNFQVHRSLSGRSSQFLAAVAISFGEKITSYQVFLRQTLQKKTSRSLKS